MINFTETDLNTQSLNNAMAARTRQVKLLSSSTQPFKCTMRVKIPACGYQWEFLTNYFYTPIIRSYLH